MPMHYRANGFVINSDIELQGWSFEGNTSNDYSLDLYRSNFEVVIDNTCWPNIYAKDGDTFFVWFDRISMRLKDNRHVIQYMLGKNTEQWELTYALNYVLAYIASFQHKLALHGCAIAGSNGMATLFLGESGIGKSTLLNRLLHQGYHFIGEEMIVVDCQSSNCFAYCSNKILRLQNEATVGDCIAYAYTDSEGKSGFWDSAYNVANSCTKIETIVMMRKSNNYERVVTAMPKSIAAKEILCNYLYMRGVVNYIPYAALIQMVMNLVANIDIVLYEVDEHPCFEDIMSILSGSRPI